MQKIEVAAGIVQYRFSPHEGTQYGFNLTILKNEMEPMPTNKPYPGLYVTLFIRSGPFNKTWLEREINSFCLAESAYRLSY